jgi:hypothetical protein
MRSLNRTMGALAALALATTALSADDSGTAVPYPEGYRAWRHVKSMLIEPGHPLYDAFGGLHHLYANELALEGYRTGRFPDGAVIVFDLLAAERKDHAVTEGERKVLGVMRRDRRRYAATGGWGFEGFVGGRPTERAVRANAKTACFDCHVSQASREFVFSTLAPE